MTKLPWKFYHGPTEIMKTFFLTLQYHAYHEIDRASNKLSFLGSFEKRWIEL